MRALMVWLLGAALLMGFAVQADAKRTAKKPKQYATHQAVPGRRTGGAEGQWYPRDALRENRLTCCN